MDINTDTLIPDKWKCLAVEVAKYGSICYRARNDVGTYDGGATSIDQS